MAPSNALISLMLFIGLSPLGGSRAHFVPTFIGSNRPFSLSVLLGSVGTFPVTINLRQSLAPDLAATTLAVQHFELHQSSNQQKGPETGASVTSLLPASEINPQFSWFSVGGAVIR
jgi:hypothetical protein